MSKGTLESRLKYLVESLGGSDRLGEILEVFYQAMQKDVMIGFFFAGKDIDKIAQMQKAFILKVAGLSKEYPGKLPNHAHLNLPPILRGHFDRRLVILKQVLTDQGVSSETTQIWLEFEEAFRNVVES